MLDRVATSTRDRLVSLATSILADNPSARPDYLGASLREAGLTSLDTVKLVLAVENEFGITVGPDDFDPVNFETLDALEGLVRRLSA